MMAATGMETPMAEPSLFAHKLRAFRARSGTNGRMTQEELANLLDVSVDSIGKYERSVSFVRGDLEHRLVERLGWKPAEVAACRSEWEVNHLRPGQCRYKLLDEMTINETFGGSLENVTTALLNFSHRSMEGLPQQFSAFEGPWSEFNVAFPKQWSAVLFDGEIVAKWVMALLNSADEALFRSGRLIESELTAECMRRPILPGNYFGYCPALVVKPGHEGASQLLFASFIDFLEDLSERDILLHGIGAITVSGAGAQVSRDLGMVRLCDHESEPEFGIWELKGSALPTSIFGRRSEVLRLRYNAEFGTRSMECRQD